MTKRTSRRQGFGNGKGVPTDAASVSLALAEVMASPWVDVIVMSTVLGIGRCVGYEEAKKGNFGAFKVGSQYRIPTAPLREALHLPASTSTAEHVISDIN